MSQSVSFIGTGIMGLPMAGHLLDKGFDLTVHSRTRSKAAALEGKGARWADTPSAAAGAQVICLCVPDTPDVEQVLFGNNGVAAAAKRGAVVIDHSTISPIATREFAARLAERGITLLDAPLSGGDVGARNGTLSIMVGGDAAVLERVRPVLQAYGKTIAHCGGPGTGQFTKLVNQVLVSINLAAVGEALKFASAAGLDLPTTIQATGGGAAASWQLLNLGPKIAQDDYRPGFMIDLLLKDLRILWESSEALQVPLPLASAVHDLFVAAQSAGFGREGTQAVYKVMRRSGE